MTQEQVKEILEKVFNDINQLNNLLIKEGENLIYAYINYGMHTIHNLNITISKNQKHITHINGEAYMYMINEINEILKK